MSDLMFYLYHGSELVQVYNFCEAEVYEDFLLETAHDLCRELGGTVRVVGRNVVENTEWWAFSYVRSGLAMFYFSPMGIREVGWDDWLWEIPEEEVHEVKLRVSASQWHHAKHGVPTGDHSIRASRKREANKLNRRVGKALIREQL